jgi:hypothetical protein
VTDRPDSPDAPDSPEIAEVRRLLAEARHTEPMPDDVADRMNAVLARLRDETPAARAEADQRPGAVVPIAAHRRRRAAGLLVAAAAIVVAGVAVAPHIPRGSSGGPAETAAGDRAADQSGNRLGSTSNHGSPGPQAVQPSSGHLPPVRVQDGRVVVRPRHFTADALQARQRLKAQTVTPDASRPSCAGVPAQAELVPAEYQKAPAALVFRAVEGSSQVVDLYVCGDARPIRSATLPAP